MEKPHPKIMILRFRKKEKNLSGMQEMNLLRDSLIFYLLFVLSL